jgi:hypothetical protein
METAGIASACNSFWEVEGIEAGATGAEGAFGSAQHSGVRQCLQSQAQELPAGATEATASGDTAATGRDTRTSPSNNAIAILVSFSAMPGFSSRFQNETASKL